MDKVQRKETVSVHRSLKSKIRRNEQVDALKPPFLNFALRGIAGRYRKPKVNLNPLDNFCFSSAPITIINWLKNK
jgi:hypothetical protein